MPSTITDRRSGTSGAGVTVDRQTAAQSRSALKAPVRATTTGVITLAGLQTLDGVVLEAGDRVLVKDQVDTTDNGIYVASTGDWLRAPDWDDNADVTRGTQVFVTDGDVNGSRWFTTVATNPVVVGTSLVSFDINTPPTGDGTALQVLKHRWVAAAGQTVFNGADATPPLSDLPEGGDANTFVVLGRVMLDLTVDYTRAGVNFTLVGDTAEEDEIFTVTVFQGGAKGWSPSIVTQADGDRIVFQLAGYTGGAGAAPTENVGLYLKADGSFTETIGDAQDVRGGEGKSAYQVAVDNGFVGDEAAWLASLHGADGGDGENGEDGIDGASALTPVRAVATSNVTIATDLNNGDTIDGVVLATSDIVLLTGQTAPAENGPYVVGAVPARHAAFATYNAFPARYFSVSEGTANADTLWRCTSDAGGTINVTALAFQKVASEVASQADVIAGTDNVKTLTSLRLRQMLDNAPLSGIRDVLINGDGSINQRTYTTVADDTYWCDRHYVLAQTAAITPTILSDVADGLPSMMRLTQSQAAAQRMGNAQIVEAKLSKRFRGKKATLGGRLRCSAAQAIRFAILEWTGTADSVTSDVVNNWTSGTYTAGNFFLASNLTVAAVGTLTPAANTVTDWSLVADISSSCNNLILVYWTEGTAAQNVTLDMAWGCVRGDASAERWPYATRHLAQELALCLRYCWVYAALVTNDVVPGSPGFAPLTTSVNLYMDMPVPMRATPALAVSNATHFLVGDGTANPGVTSITISIGRPDIVSLSIAAAGLTQFRPYYFITASLSARLTFDAEL